MKSICLLSALLTINGVTAVGAAEPSAADRALATKAEAVFGRQAGQSFDAASLRPLPGRLRSDSLSLTLAPGKGAEVKAKLRQGQGFWFQWQASGPVAVDMHGEREGAKDAYTSYAIEGAQSEGSGAFEAGFDGLHGWYWLNRSSAPITLKVTVMGVQERLLRAGP
jgi:hypothetical protein